MAMNSEHIIAQILLRLWPFPRGAGRITEKLFSKLIFREEIAEVSTTDGFRITVMPNELIGRQIYLTGEFDRSTVEILCNFARPGDTLLDIGANIGYVSACFLKNVPDSNVIAIEPQPKIVDLLRRNLSNFPDRHQIFSIALSDRDGISNFFVDTHNYGASKIVTHDGPGTQPVEMWSVGTMLAKARPAKINLIKLDIEGHEEHVLFALKPALEQFRPRAIVFEHHSKKSAPNQPIGALMRSAGYEVFGLKKYLTKLKLEQIASETDCVYNDYVAVST
jgi:FkbM family methyltransferase